MSLQVWLPLNGDLHNQGLSNITVTNNGATIDNSGKIGKCYSFNGTSNYLISNSTFLDNNIEDFSYTCWFKPSNTTTMCLLSNRTLEKSTGIAIFYKNNGFYFDDGARWESSISIVLNQWNHLVFIRKKGQFKKIYLNGEEVASTTITNTPAIANSSCFSIGGSQAAPTNISTNYLNGFLNDVRIYDHALSAKEVEEIAKGLVLHYKLDQPNNNILTQEILHIAPFVSATTFVGDYEGYNDVLSVRNNTLYQKTSSGKNDIFTGITWDGNVQYTLSGIWRDDRTDGKNSSMQFRFHYTDNTTTTIKSPQSKWGQWIPFKLTSTAGKSVDKITTTYGNAGDIYIANFKLEIGPNQTPFLGFIPNNIIYDSSGYNNNGTIVGSLEAIIPSPRYSCTTKFDGVTSCIKIPYNEINPDRIFTVNLWFYKDALGSKSYETLFGGPSGFEMDTRAGAATSLSLYMASTRGGTVSPLNLNEWTMITMARNETNEFYYINGELKKTVEAKSMPSGQYRIGAWSSDTRQNYYGEISDFRIYATALTAEQVKELYQNSLIVDGTNTIPRNLE